MEKSDLIISKISNKDIDTVFMLNKQTDYQYTFSVLEEMFCKDYLIFKAQINCEILGFIIVKVVFEDAELISIVVDKNHQKKGIAKSLLGFALTKARQMGARRMLLEVDEKNIRAISLYKKMGFNDIAVRKNYYGDNSALIMQLSLD